MDPTIKQKITLSLITNGCYGSVAYHVSLVFDIIASTFENVMECSTTKTFESKDEFMKFAKESLLYLEEYNEAYVEYNYVFNSKKEWINLELTEVYRDGFELLDPDDVPVDPVIYGK